MTAERVVIIGGDAAGMSAVSRIRKGRPDAEIVALERGPLDQLLGLRHPLPRGRGGRRRRRAPRGPLARGAPGAAGPTCGRGTRRRPSTWTPGRSRCAPLDGDHVPPRLRPAAHRHRGHAHPPGPARHRPAVHPRRADPRRRRPPARPRRGSGRALPARRRRRQRLHRPGDGRGLRRAGVLGASSSSRPRSRWGRSTRTWVRWWPTAMVDHGLDLRCGVAVTGFEPETVLTDDGPIDADLVVLGIGVGAERDAGRRGRPRARREGRHPRRRAAGHVGAGRVGGGRLRREPPPRHGPARPHRRSAPYANKQGRVAGINIGGGYASVAGRPRHGHHQAVRHRDRPHRPR